MEWVLTVSKRTIGRPETDRVSQLFMWLVSVYRSAPRHNAARLRMGATGAESVVRNMPLVQHAPG